MLYSIPIRKTMFLLVLDWERALDPRFEEGRFTKLWLAEHWIPAVFLSIESHTMRPIRLHCGHFISSPSFMPCFLLSSCY